MNLSHWWWTPSVVVALITALAATAALCVALWQAKVQLAKEEQSSSKQAKNDEILRLVAARVGDQNSLKELIEEQTRKLSDEAKPSKRDLDELLAKVPTSAEAYNKLQRNIAEQGKANDVAFRSTWEPLIRYVLNSFDSNVKEVRSHGYDLQLQKAELKVTDIDGERVSTIPIRGATIGRYGLLLNYRGFPVNPASYASSDGRLFLMLYERGEERQLLFQLVMAPKKITLQTREANKELPAPEDGTPQNEVIDFVNERMLTGIEQLLVLAKAEEAANGSLKPSN